MKFNYEQMYSTCSDEYRDYLRKAGIWKAHKLCELIKNEKTETILEIGTGRGDVLNACYPFKVKSGADISEEALKQHHNLYTTHKLIKIDANKPLPFRDNEVDFVLLCDILEHVDNPLSLLKEAARIGKYLLLKIPVENAFLFRLMQKLHGTKYGPAHPSGHLHCWTLPETQNLIEQAGLKIIRKKFLSTPVNLLEKKNLLKTITVSLISLADFLTVNNFFSRILIGGSLFAVARK